MKEVSMEINRLTTFKSVDSDEKGSYRISYSRENLEYFHHQIYGSHLMVIS